MLLRTLVLKVSGWSLTEKIVRRSPLFRGLVSRFIAGDTVQEALDVCEGLAQRGFTTSLDLLGENVKSVDEANRAKETYIAMLQDLAKSPCRERTNISIKLTQCGFDQSDALVEANYLEVLRAAREVDDCFVRVDMEASAYTERTVELIKKVWPEFKNTGTVLQSALHRTPQDVRTFIDLGARVRMVKGAYLEPESVAYQDKGMVDEAYITLSKQLMAEGNYPAFATHDEKIVDALKAFATEKGIPPERYEFQMLYGVRRDLQDGLLAEGYNVRVYVPFGDSWYPYFTRRLAERPANMLFIIKSLFKG